MHSTTEKNTQSFGKILSYLRKQKLDSIEGKVWSQQKLAEISGLSTKIIGDIERGRRAHIDSDIAIRLANALGLSTLQRKYFYEQANPHNSDLMSYQEDPSLRVQQYITILGQTKLPALIHDGLLNIIAANTLWLSYASVTEIDWESPILPYNLLRLMVDPKSNLYKQMGANKNSAINTMLQNFRAYSICALGTEKYAHTLRELMTIPRFNTLWITSHHHFEVTTVSPHPKAHGGLQGQKAFMKFRPVSERVVTNSGSFYVMHLVPTNEIAFKYLQKQNNTVTLDVKLLHSLELSCTTT